MIKYTEGNILDSSAEALINTVNTVGIMGKGIALQFKNAFKSNYKAYKEACENNEVEVGKLFVFKDINIMSGEKLIINFPTKTHWRKPSEYDYISQGLDDLIKVIEHYKIKSIAIPPLGSGNGGLNWVVVKELIKQKLSAIDIEIQVYEPNSYIKEVLKKERVKLTKARALFLYVLYDLVKHGEYVSEFSSEKVCYFLQRFGGKKYLKLNFEPKFYGPYSGKVRFLLNVLNGSYIMGYSDMNKKPFEPLTLIPDGYDEVKKTVENDSELNLIANKTTTFLRGFYSDFSLELLSSLDYIAVENNSLVKESLQIKLNEWNDRKRSMFSNPRYINISIKRLQEFSSSLN